MNRLIKTFLLSFVFIYFNQIVNGQFTVFQTSTLADTYNYSNCGIGTLNPNGYPWQNVYDPCDQILSYISLHNFTTQLTFRYLTKVYKNGVFQYETEWPYVGHPNWPDGWLTHNIGSNSWHCNEPPTSEGDYHLEFFVRLQSGNPDIYCGMWDYSVSEHPDYAPLMELYNSTNGPGWTNNSGWVDGAAGTNCDPCNGWYGVTCTNGRVTSLNLQTNSLNGTLPIAIGNLSNLDYLNISFSPLLSGNIPSSIGNLSNLSWLVLRANELDGPIPSSIGQLTNLTQLDLFNNNLSETIPSSMGNLLLLTHMKLGTNNLSGCIPEELQNICVLIPNGINGSITNNPLLNSQSWSNFCNNQEGMCGNCTVTPASNSPNVCVNTFINITHFTTGATGIGTPSGLPAGVTASWSGNVITISGAPISSGTFSYNIPLAGPAGCSNTSATGTIIVNPANTVGPPSSNPTVCINSSMPIVTISTTGATGIGTPTGLPPGVSANWLGNNITISGTPLSLGVSNYTIPLIGGCGNINASGTITVIDNNTATSQSSTDPICTNALMTNVTHTTTGATGINTPLGLPPGITASWFGNTIVISGTPTAQGTYNYSIPLTGGCGSISAAGVLNVTPVNSVSTPSSTPTLCVNSALTSITHTTSGATNIGTAIGLPQGINASWSNNTITISGIPSEAGTFNYSIALTGGCGNVNATGTIFVTPLNTVSSPLLLETCVGENMNDVFITTTGATDIDVPSGLPLGLSALWNNNTITLSGTPLEAGTFNYSIPLLGGCGTINANGTIIVNDVNTASPPTLNPQICLGNDIPTISINTTGASGIGTPSGLPPGVTASFNINNNTITISGTPTSSDNFDYEIPLVGGCGEVKVQGIITVYDLPKITIEIQPLSGFLDPNGYTCKGSKFELTAYGGGPFNEATWENDMPNGFEITITETMDFAVSITDVNGCENDTTFSIFVYDTLNYTLSPSNLKLCSDTMITFNPQQSVNALSFMPGNGLNGYTSGNKFIASPANSSCQNCTFDLEFIDNNSCAVKNSHTLSFGKSEVLSTENVTTQGGNDGSATINVINSIAPYDVTVNGGPIQEFSINSFTLDSLQEGTYNITVTDNGGCTTTASFVINGIDCPMVVSDSIEHIVCYGDSTGKILLTVTGAVGTISFNWQNNLGSSSMIDSLRAGSYSVTITDDKCDIRKTYKVSQPLNPLNINADITHPGCGAWDGKITINALGGWMPYETIHPDTMLTGLSAETYSFYVIDSLGCRFDTDFTLLVTPGPNDIPSFINLPSDITISCENAPQAGYLPTLTYGYPECGVDSSGVVIASISIDGDICSGQTIVYRWEFRDTFDHIIIDSQRVYIQSPLSPEFTNPPANTTINYSSLATTLQSNTLSYTNSENGVCSISGIVSSIDSLGLVECSGIVTRTWKVMFCNDQDSIEHIQNITVMKDDILAPLVNCVASNETSITFGWTNVPQASDYNVIVTSPVGLTGAVIPGQNQYQFAGLTVGQSVTIQVEAIIPGPCGNVISSAHTCTALDCGPLPNVTIDIPVAFCLNDQPFNLDSSRVTIYPPIQNSIGRFEINSVPVTQINLQELGPGTHTITYRTTWNNGQCSQVGDTTFTIYPVPSAEFTISSVNSCITDPTTVTYIGNAQGTTFNWNFGSDVIGSFSGPGPHQMTWANPGNKIITLSISKNGCNSSTIDTTVVIYPLLLPPIITCLDQTIDGLIFGWNPVNGANSYDISVNVVGGAILYQGNVTNTTYEVTGLQEGTEVVISVTAKSNNACPDATSQLICVAESCPNATLTIPERNISACLSETSSPIPLLFSITDTIADISPIIRWTSNKINVNNAINNNDIPPTFDPLIAGVGEYFVRLSYQQKSCIWEDSIRISIKAKPIATGIMSQDSICISDTLFVNTSPNELPQIWSSSGTILSGQSSELCKVKFSNPGINNVQLSYSNGTCTSDTLSKSVFVAPEQKAPEIQCETIGNTILFSWQDTECTKSYEVWRDGEIIQSSTQNEYLASSIKKGETIEISLITNTNCPCPIPSTTKSCTLDENDDCDMELRDDYHSIVINQPYSFDILLNDFIPYDSFTVNILGYDDDFIKDIQFRESLEATVLKPFFDTLAIVYEVCTPDCIDCVSARLLLTNEVLKDIFQTNIILPNTSGGNATLRFTDEDILKDSELYIFNRNGDRIFHMKDYDNSWNADGYPGGIYFYVLRYRGVDIKKTLTVMK